MARSALLFALVALLVACASARRLLQEDAALPPEVGPIDALREIAARAVGGDLADGLGDAFEGLYDDMRQAAEPLTDFYAGILSGLRG